MPCKIPIVTPSIIYFSLTGKFRFFTPAFWPTPVLEKILLLPVIFIVVFTACAVATSSCISDVRSQWEGRNFDPPQLPHFSTDLNETQNQERYPGYDPTRKIWLMWNDGKAVCVGRAFSGTFCVPSFFVYLPSPTGHTRRPITTVNGSKRVFPRKVGPLGVKKFEINI